MLGLRRLALRTRIVCEATGARLGARNVALELVLLVLHRVEAGSARAVLLGFLVVKVVLALVFGARRYLMAPAGIALTQRELAGAEDVLRCAQQVALAADVGQAEADAATRGLRSIPAILR